MEMSQLKSERHKIQYQLMFVILSHKVFDFQKTPALKSVNDMHLHIYLWLHGVQSV